MVTACLDVSCVYILYVQLSTVKEPVECGYEC